MTRVRLFVQAYPLAMSAHFSHAGDHFLFDAHEEVITENLLKPFKMDKKEPFAVFSQFMKFSMPIRSRTPLPVSMI